MTVGPRHQKDTEASPLEMATGDGHCVCRVGSNLNGRLGWKQRQWTASSVLVLLDFGCPRWKDLGALISGLGRVGDSVALQGLCPLKFVGILTSSPFVGLASPPGWA